MRRNIRWQIKRLLVVVIILFCFLNFGRVFLALESSELNSFAADAKPRPDLNFIRELYQKQINNEEVSLDEEYFGASLTIGPTVSIGPMYSDEVINPHPYSFTLTNPNACVGNADGDSSSNELFLLLLVKCSTSEILDRAQIRRTWGGVRYLKGRRTLTMFLLGLPESAEEQGRIIMEDAIHHDVIQENFLDTYRNLTVKNMMGWKWMMTYCPHATYAASIDADMHLNIHNLLAHLETANTTNYAEGHLKPTDKPMRNPEDKANIKWYTPPEMYPETTYPPFLNGACYVMSGDVARRIFKTSLHVRFLPWDDVFVGMVMKRLGVSPSEHLSFEQFRRLHRTRDYLRAFAGGIATGVGHNRKTMDSKVISVWDYISTMHLILNTFKNST
ncbi:beta-1,3-galactosyltransferase 5-like [Asterias amurensis]|uniref:beta-1,3-galactosyltransferase 5-like n=1 Tax=Asterias amurensis TaxID=7602 RepID=UPI003AB62847